VGRDLQVRARRRPSLPELRAGRARGPDWIGFYNGGRLHEALGDVRPAEYEELNYRRDNTPILSAT